MADRPWIEWIEDEDASDRLARSYGAARERAGKVFHIVRIMGQNPDVLDDSMAFYVSLMKRRSPLSRAQREMLATAVSRLNECGY